MQISSISSVVGVDATSPASPVASGQAPGHATGTHSAAQKDTEQSQGNLTAAEEALAAVYTSSVAGHHFAGTVQQTDGQYIASAADPPSPPVTGIGPSIQAAENNLTLVLDERA